MILSFSVENFRSINEKSVIDFKASKKFSKENKVSSLFELEDFNEDILNSLLIYGANASGKSNILKAIHTLDVLVNSSMDFKVDSAIEQYEPFRLNEKNKDRPTSFEIDFIAKNKSRYIYKIAFNSKSILLEELYYFGGDDLARKNLLYTRNIGKEIKFGNTYRGIRKFNIYSNQLILSQVAKTPNDILLPVYQFFKKYLYCSTIHDTQYDDELIKQITSLLEDEDSSFRRNINRLIRAADTAIQEIVVKEHNESDFKFPDGLSESAKKRVLDKYKKRVKSIHYVYDENNDNIGIEEFELEEESTGTIKLLVIGGLIINALSDGSVLVIDELDKSLHPLLTKMLIGLFLNPDTNPNKAQLVLATHDITLLDKEIFRLDQIIFTDKNLNGGSSYTKLSSYTGLSKLAHLATWYLLGRFGGIPMIDEYELDLEVEKSL